MIRTLKKKKLLLGENIEKKHPVFQFVTRENFNLVLKLHNPMKNCVTRR